MTTEEIIVVGGGAAGFFAAIHLAESRPTARITILERGKAVLEKVRVSGGGRCNVTHACWTPRELVKHYPRGSKELLSPFNRFACGDTMGWFEDRGVSLKIEEDGRIFPTTDDSATIIDCLWQAAKKLGVRVITRCRVDAIERAESSSPKEWLVKAGDRPFPADRLVVTSGSNPAVWKLLAKLGLALIPPVPSLFAFNIPDKQLHALSGTSLSWAAVNIGDEKLKAEGPLLITHKGFSGPAILRLSAWGARQLAPLQYRFQLSINWLAKREEEVNQELLSLSQELHKQQLGSHGHLGLSQRLWKYLLTKAEIPPTTRWAELSKKNRQKLAQALTNCPYRVDGKATNKEEFVTAGGVDLKEVDFKSFSAKQYPTLHLAGEVLDIDAITGGFNFQAAWTGGWVIGQADS